MIYFYLEVKMENQINIGDQNSKKIGQNPDKQYMPISEKPKTNYLAIVITVLVSFIVFGVGGYYLGLNNQQYQQKNSAQQISSSPTEVTQTTPNINPTTPPISKEGWSTYNNTQNFYTISYPSDWQVDNYKGVFVNIPGEVTFTPPSELSIQAENFRTKVAIMMMTTEKIRYNLNTQELFDEWLVKNVSNGQGERLYKSANATVDGNKAVKFVSRALPGDHTEAFFSIVVWLRKDGANYYFELGGDENKVRQNVLTFDKMLQSVKFTR